MAEGTTLQLKFDTMSGASTMNFNYAKPAATATQVGTLVNAIIANNSIFKAPPIRATSAKLITTSETVINLDS